MKKSLILSISCLMALYALAESQPNAVRFEQDNGKDFYMLNATVTMPQTGSTSITINGKNYDLSENSVKTYFCEIGTYIRIVTNDNWGTLCLPWQGVKMEGGKYYDVLGTKDAEKGVALVELETTDDLVAGKPYVFKATSNQIKVTYYPSTKVEEEVYDGNHIIGSFAGCTVPVDNYIILNNLLYKTEGTSTVGANRAYFDADNMGDFEASKAPARVVFMGGHQAPTDIEVHNARCTMHDGKYLINGQFVIIRDGKTYNAQGIEL